MSVLLMLLLGPRQMLLFSKLFLQLLLLLMLLLILLCLVLPLFWLHCDCRG